MRKMEMLTSVSVKMTCMSFFLDQAWDHLSKSYVYLKNGSPINLLELIEVDLCWKYLVLSFSLLHLHHAYLRLKECMHSSTCVVFCIKRFQKSLLFC